MEQTDSYQRGERRGDWMKDREVINQRTYMHNSYTDSSVVMSRGKGEGKGWMGADKGRGGITTPVIV